MAQSQSHSTPQPKRRRRPSKTGNKAKSNPSTPPSSPLPRAIVYIDAYNLYYGCLKHTPYRWLDIQQMCCLMLPDYQVLAIKYYTARIRPPANDPDKAVRQEVYLRALTTLPLVSITYGQYLSHKIKRPLANPPTGGPTMVEIINNEEKGSDVNLGAHMILDGVRDAYDVAVVVSNDSDLQEPMRIVAQELNKSVGLLCPLNKQRRMSRQLAKHATLTRPIREGVLKASQFPPTVTDRRGTIHQPPKWTHG